MHLQSRLLYRAALQASIDKVAGPVGEALIMTAIGAAGDGLMAISYKPEPDDPLLSQIPPAAGVLAAAQRHGLAKVGLVGSQQFLP